MLIIIIFLAQSDNILILDTVNDFRDPKDKEIEVPFFVYFVYRLTVGTLKLN